MLFFGRQQSDDEGYGVDPDLNPCLVTICVILAKVTQPC